MSARHPAGPQPDTARAEQRRHQERAPAPVWSSRSSFQLLSRTREDRTAARRSHIAAGHRILARETVAGNSSRWENRPMADSRLATAAGPASCSRRCAALAWAVAAIARRRSRRRPRDDLCRRAPRRSGGRHRGRPGSDRGRRARHASSRGRGASACSRCSPGSRGSAPTGRARRAPNPLLRSLGAAGRAVLARARLPPRARRAGGRVRSPAGAAGGRGGIRGPAAVTMARALLRDPLLDLYCWRNCSRELVSRPCRCRRSRALVDQLLLWSALADRASAWSGSLAPAAPGDRPGAASRCCRCSAPRCSSARTEATYAAHPPSDATRGSGPDRVRRDLPCAIALVHRARASGWPGPSSASRARGRA